MQSHQVLILLTVVLMASLAMAKPVPGYKPGMDPLAEAKWVLHRNIKKEYGNEKWYEALKNSNVKFIQAEEMAVAAKSQSSQASALGKPAAAATAKPSVSAKLPAKKPSFG